LRSGEDMAKVGDFIKLNYTGKLQDGTVFDTTDAALAKKIGAKKSGPVTICVGQRMLIPGLDAALVGKSGKFTVTLQPEAAFGQKDPKLLKIVPTAQLLKQGIRPQPGMRLNIDGDYGVVRSAAPGRTVVDFNHPLASQEITYDVEILGKVEDTKEQITALLEPIGVPFNEIHITKDAATIHVPQMFPGPVLEALQERITKLTTIKTVSFEQGTKPKRDQH
jgi:FKBP-type peptidyl-prolyl cis-trans isomerase 2